MTKSFEKNIDDLKFQVELGITETISANNREDINKVNSLEINSNLEHDSNELSEINTLKDKITPLAKPLFVDDIMMNASCHTQQGPPFFVMVMLMQRLC